RLGTLHAPAWGSVPSLQDERFHMRRRALRAVVRPPAAVAQRLARKAAFQPLVPGAACDLKLPAQRAEVCFPLRGLYKFFPLLFHSSALPRHTDLSFSLRSLCLLFYCKTVYHVFATLYTILFHCPPLPRRAT